MSISIHHISAKMKDSRELRKIKNNLPFLCSTIEIMIVNSSSCGTSKIRDLLIDYYSLSSGYSSKISKDISELINICLFIESGGYSSQPDRMEEHIEKTGNISSRYTS